MALGQQPQPEILRHVGVLVFVHQHVFEAALILFQHVRVFLEDAQHLQQQVAEVGGVHHLQPLLVFFVELPAEAIGEARGFARRNAVRRQPAVLPAIDEGGELAGGPALLVNVMGFQQLLQQADLVIRVEDGEAGPEARKLRVVPQDLDPDRMEGAEPGHALDRPADQRADAVAHLARRLVGEGHGEELPRPGPAGGKDVGQPGGQHPRLAGAGTCQHQQGAVGRFHRGPLFRVQALEIGGLALLAQGARRQPSGLHRGGRLIVAKVVQVEVLVAHQVRFLADHYSNRENEKRNLPASGGFTWRAAGRRLQAAHRALKLAPGFRGVHVAHPLTQQGMLGRF